MTEQEITQARADLALLDIEQLRCGVMLQLLHIDALTKERDAALEQNTELDARCAKLESERDALMSAAKLALDALDAFAEWEDMGDPQRPATEAIETLRRAGVQ